MNKAFMVRQFGHHRSAVCMVQFDLRGAYPAEKGGLSWTR